MGLSKLRQDAALLMLGLSLVTAGTLAEVTSIADWPCDQWSARRDRGERLDPPQMWLAGYMTGLASAYKRDVLSITNAQSIFNWMDAYCEAYPDEPISTGALVLFNELAIKLPRGPALNL